MNLQITTAFLCSVFPDLIKVYTIARMVERVANCVQKTNLRKGEFIINEKCPN